MSAISGIDTCGMSSTASLNDVILPDASGQFEVIVIASAFLASSPDPQWSEFVWMKEGGHMLPVVATVGDMERKPVEMPKPKPKPPDPGPQVCLSIELIE